MGGGGGGVTSYGGLYDEAPQGGGAFLPYLKGDLGGEGGLGRGSGVGVGCRSAESKLTYYIDGVLSPVHTNKTSLIKPGLTKRKLATES